MSENKAITIDAITSKEFTIGARGYDQMEVDTFLDEICDEMERREAVEKQLRQQLKEAQNAATRAAQAPAPKAVEAAAPVAASAASSFQEILEMAQKGKNETIAEAQKKADEMLANAEDEVRVKLGDLTKERDTLTTQVDGLKATLTDYRSRFAALLKEQQEAMDKLNDL